MGKPRFEAESETVQCSAPGCDRGSRTNGYCGKHYQRLRNFASLDLPPRPVKEWARCTAPDCSKPARTVCGSVCEMHYGRMRRNGVYDAPVWGQWRQTDHGYMMKRDLEHPLATKNGYLYQHRAVLYDAIGAGPHACHWCKAEVDWRARGERNLVVDHLDGVKTNNMASNLVASCHRCNSTRGLFQRWVMDHRDDPFLWSLYETAKAA